MSLVFAVVALWSRGAESKGSIPSKGIAGGYAIGVASMDNSSSFTAAISIFS